MSTLLSNPWYTIVEPPKPQNLNSTQNRKVKALKTLINLQSPRNSRTLLDPKSLREARQARQPKPAWPSPSEAARFLGFRDQDLGFRVSTLFLVKMSVGCSRFVIHVHELLCVCLCVCVPLSRSLALCACAGIIYIYIYIHVYNIYIPWSDRMFMHVPALVRLPVCETVSCCFCSTCNVAAFVVFAWHVWKV